MRKLKYKLMMNDWYDLSKEVNAFLDTIDASQVVKIESFDKGCAITYLELPDVRDIKLEMLVK